MVKEAFGVREFDVALRGIATQSSLYNYYYASFAIDGNKASVLSASSCTHTNVDYGVDLLAVYDISNVIITNRGDACADRINGAEIHIGNSLINNGNNNPSLNKTLKHSTKIAHKGRYVNVIIPNIAQYLTLCEVEVYGVPVSVFKRLF
ncbi:fucolectin-4-like [Tachysurus fulvidraco]|uniref:fucolectin-4-like n=1 Tax=Tachysurus fulvidraco TaxID=1234273 RepID=UPI001FF078EA|nr:fucolectin-4-like [Tachysurus fulvidraco]